MRILIFGSGGFVGSHILNAIKDSLEHEVRAPLRRDLELNNSGLLREYMTGFAPDLVVNCAIKVSSLEESVTSAMNILRAMPEAAIYFQVGSGAEYGRFNCPANVSEDYFGTYIPEDSYGLSKFLIAQTLETVLQGRFLSIRTFGVFGTGEEERRLIPSLVKSAKDRGHAQIKQDGLFSFVPVEDIVLFFMKWLETGCSLRGSHNFCGTTPILISRILQHVKEKIPAATYKIEKCGIQHPYTGDSSGLIQVAPWFKFSDINSAIQAYLTEITKG